MKLKKRSLALLMIISLTVSVMQSYASAPKINALEQQISVDDVGYSYAASNREFLSEIYRLDKSGKAVTFYSEANSPGSVKSYITELTQYGDMLYAVRQSIDQNTNAMVRQEVISLPCGEVWIKPKVLYTYQGVGLPPIMSITAENDTLFICALKNSGEKAYVDAIPLSEPYKIKESMAFSAQFNNGFYYGEYHNGRLYAISKSGEVLEYYGNSMKNLLEGEEQNYGRITRLSITDGGVRFYDDLSGDAFLYNNEGELSRKKIPENEKIFAWDEAGAYALCLSEDENLECQLQLDNGQNSYIITQIQLPIYLHMVRVLPLAVLAFLSVVAVVMIIMISVRLAGRQTRIIAKFVIIIMPVVLLAFAGFGAVQFVSLRATLTATRFTMAEEFNSLTGKSLDTKAIAKINSSQDYKTYDYRVLQNILRTGNSDGTRKLNGLTVKSEVIILQDGELYTGISLEQPCFYHVSSVYSTELVRLMQRAMDENSVITQRTSDRYGRWITAVSPMQDLGGTAVGLILTRVSTSDISVYLQDYRHSFVIIMLLLTAVMLIPITVSFRSILRPLRLLENGMESVMNGEYNTTIDNGTKDEFQGITRGFNKMCADLSRQIYQLNNISNSYYRFMPRSVFKLLEKESILDVREGDLCSLTCSLSVLSVHNLSLLRSLMSDMEFMTYIGKITDYINDTVQRCNGVLMSSDMDLSRLKVIFPAKSSDAAEFALAISEYFHSGEMQVKDIFPETTIILHHTDMLYGITGKRDLIFPFLMSSEADFITQVIQRFGGSGARIVITGEFHSMEEEKQPERYIGYMMQNKNKRYELYQLLPMGAFDRQHSSQEKAFANGLEEFYHGDFYNARSLFSIALKSMPDNGIARWYVLAADKYYQYPGQYINHELFGTDIHLM